MTHANWCATFRGAMNCDCAGDVAAAAEADLARARTITATQTELGIKLMAQNRKLSADLARLEPLRDAVRVYFGNASKPYSRWEKDLLAALQAYEAT